ncbi:MAG TPA: Gfo/Idh/MocA family oxidoreductase [Chloroflexi bacterium]|jgi:predicted dehydrogenase|nr:Gfo/Idh/MocA family oxidoreductase [Chloroflexota bacterium]
MTTVKIGIVGCGNISAAYLRTARLFRILEVAACADIDMERARARADEFDVPRACSVEELLADPEIQIVVNLTTPQAHTAVNLAAIEAGKHVYTEKPLAVTREEGARVLAAARAKGVRVGCAPGTFLGGGLQTCRKLIDEGAIGEPIACAAFMMSRGHESWHPDPAYYYKTGAGPMFDMGPYYLTALATLMGRINRVTGSARILIGERTITSQPKYGEKIIVETPDHVTGTIEFDSGAVGTIITTFAAWRARLPRIEIYGTEGTLGVPDPNSLDGPVGLCRLGKMEWEDVPLTHGHTDRNKWGIGVAEMAHAILAGRPHRATGEQGYHVLDAMQGFLDASESGQHYKLISDYTQPTALPVGLPDDALDD